MDSQEPTSDKALPGEPAQDPVTPPAEALVPQAMVLAAESSVLGPDPLAGLDEVVPADLADEGAASEGPPLAGAAAPVAAMAKPDPRAVAGLMAVMALSAVDVMIVGTAMPFIIGSLGGLALYPWVFTAFILASTLAMPFAGRLADAKGMRPVLFGAIAIFLVGSLACAWSQNMPMLVASRALQGLGAGALTALIFTAFGALYPPERRGSAQALISGVWGVASLAGPPLGGFLVTHVSWPLIFLLNLPVGVVATALLVRYYPRTPPAGKAFRFDPVGAALLVGGLVAMVVGLEGHQLPWWVTPLGAVALVAFFLQQSRIAEPIAPTSLFRHKAYAAAVAAGILPFATVFAVNNFLPLYLQGAMGLRADLAGAVMLPASVAWPLAAAIAGIAVNRLGFRNLCAVGAGLLLLGASALASMKLGEPTWHIVAYATVLCFGMGLLAATTMIMGQSSVPRSVIGSASGTLLLTRNLAVTLGVGALGALQVQGFAKALAAQGLPADEAERMVRQLGGLPLVAREALAHSIGPIFLLTAAASAATLFLVLAMVPSWTPREAADAASGGENPSRPLPTGAEA